MKQASIASWSIAAAALLASSAALAESSPYGAPMDLETAKKVAAAVH